MKFEFTRVGAPAIRQTVAGQYPAKPQDSGGYLFRPKYQGRNPPAMWGWTASLDMAHPDYFKDGDVPRGCQRIEINGRSVLVHLASIEEPLTEKDQAAIQQYADFLELGIEAIEGVPDTGPETTQEQLDQMNQRAIEKTQPPKENSVTELTMDGPDLGRYTEHMRYRLPPELERAEVKFDGYKRYKLPSPSTGKLTAFTRSTTVSSTTGDHYNLGLWKQRTKVQAVLIAKECYDIVNNVGNDELPEDLTSLEIFGRTLSRDDIYFLSDAYVDLLKAWEDGKAQDPNRKIDAIDNHIGGAEAREHGQAVHEWLGAVDSGQVLLWQVPEEYVTHVTSYQACLQRAGLIAVPIYVERIVLNDHGEETVAGTIDRIYLCVETGELYLGDLKTSKTLEWSALEYGIQFAIYGFARLMLRLDGTGWDDMPEINLEQCFCVHVPSDQPERSQVVPFYLYPGGEFAVTALEVRRQRKEADKKIFGGAYPIPSERSLRYVEARQALQNMHDVEEAQAIMQQYEDVWDDALTGFGATCFEAITSTLTEGN